MTRLSQGHMDFNAASTVQSYLEAHNMDLNIPVGVLMNAEILYVLKRTLSAFPRRGEGKK